jgi:ABC-2 type transport system permease protein
MTPFARMVAHEWRMLNAGRLAAGALIVIALAAAYAATNGARWTTTVAERITATAADEATRLGAMRAEVIEIEAGRAAAARFRDPTRAAWVGEFLGNPFATWPLAPLTAWSIGQRDLLPSYLKVGTLSRDAWMFEDEIEHPLHLALGRFDLAYVAIVLLPLIALALSFDLLSSEREAGTLPLLLAQPLTLGTVVAAKGLVRVAWLGVMVITIVGAGVLLAPPEAWSPALIARAGLWTATAFVYSVFWVGLAALVNLFGGGSAANAVRLTACWMLLVIVVPAVLALAAAALHPAPPRLVVHERGRELRRDMGPQLADILEAHYQRHPDQRPATFDQTDWAPGYYASQIPRDAALQPLYDAHDAQAAAQQALVDRWRWISPALLAQASFHDLSGTSPREFQRFMAAVASFHDAWRAFFYPRLFARAPMTAADYDRLPAFRFVPEPERAVFGRVLGRLAGLAGIVGLVFGLCNRRALR